MQALERRNYLVHQFFADHAAAFMVADGRVQMIAELRTIAELFHRVEDRIGELSAPVMARLGLTGDVVDAMTREMVAQFLARTENESK